MTDEIKTPELTSEDTSTPEVVKTAKYSDEEVQKIVKDRVAREKDASTKLAKQLEEEKTSLQTLIESYESILQEVINQKMGDVPDEYKELLSKLGIMEQLEFINKSEKKLTAKKIIPSTPLPSKTDGKEISPSEATKKLRIF